MESFIISNQRQAVMNGGGSDPGVILGEFSSLEPPLEARTAHGHRTGDVEGFELIQEMKTFLL